MRKKAAIIIQARMGSTRLPGKILKKVGEYNLLEILISRLSYVKGFDELIVATTKESSDDIIESFCKKKNIKYYQLEMEKKAWQKL